MLAVVPLNPTIGRIVYQFVARDEHGDGDSNVLYKEIDVIPAGSFHVDSKSGVVRTGWSKYERGETYRISAQAIDTTQNSTSQMSEVAILEILADERPPQFAKQEYEVTVSEDNLVDYSVVDVKAQSFRSIEDGRSKGPIIYSIEGDSSDETKWFRIDPSTGIIHLSRQLDYDDPSLPKTHKMRVTAKEDSRESHVDVTIRIDDVNDNVPTFTRPLYTAQVREDIPLNQTILKVTAIDKDSGENSHITYSVDNQNFSINEKGEISARIRLDADQFNERHFVYRFNVTAKDHGIPIPLSSTAMIHIRTENTNDESAVFLPTSQYTAFVAEDAQGGTPVIQIQARDADRDEVTYSFLDKNQRSTQTMNLFTIDQHTGLVKLRHGVSPVDLAEAENPINLTVVVQDDGSCCVYPSKTHTSYATLLIGIEDVNNNKPEFPDCAKYSEIAKIMEGAYKSDPPTIVKVQATDDDSSANGDIVYSLYYTQSESRKAFVIDRHTGVLTPSPHVVFDRETRPREDVTVKATDRGDRPLIGFCQFSVEVVDVNDNSPQFERPSYETSVSRYEAIGTSVITVFAFDNDAAHNAEISYSLEVDSTAGEEHQRDLEFFQLVNRHSGEISLIKPIPPATQKFVFNVIADDNGTPDSLQSTAQIILNVLDKQQKAPKWQTSPECKSLITVPENVEMNRVILRCRAVSSDRSSSDVIYKLAASGGPGNKAESKFRQFNKFENGNEWVEVAIMEGLDYEQVNNYTLTLTATDMTSRVASTKSFVVEVRDVNDVVPQFTVDLFTGTIDEEMTPNEYLERSHGKPIVTVKAIDTDSDGPQNEVHYRIVGEANGEETKHFRIDELTGEIFPNEKFDREKVDMYILTVEASDRTVSALPGANGPNKDNVKVQIVINDVNDNAPSFEEPKYIGRVKESEGEGHDVITIKAHDLDKHSNLRYHLVGAGGGRIPFGVRTDSGTIFVKEPLDFEASDQYHLILIASDGRHNATTNVYIHIEDVNDNAPQFEQQKYATTVIEEDVDVPKVLFNVRATDADLDEKSSRIVYRLEGQGADEVFRIGKYSGTIELMRPLDRDPPTGVPSWNFVVQAIDDDGNGLVGYADVQVNVRDINDNSPIFPERLFGFIEENREPIHSDGVYFMDVQARDFDDPTTENANIEYGIVRNKLINGEPVFRIDQNTGKIFAMRSLDREISSEREFIIEVRANDRGVPSREGFANVTIKVTDMNDNAPFFEKTHYEGSVDETAPIGAAVMSFSAFDADEEAKDNVFTYQLAEESEWFYVTTDKDSKQSSVGVLRVKQ
uniref:Cadherin domain protein n=1 Tax=Caenorhabditis tropicalis TaxID=1561998 RepID=A0A1I7UMB3_9PELO